MSQEKVNEYKKAKAGRKKNLKLEKKKKRIIYTASAIAILALSIVGGYHFGNKSGYKKGYMEGFMIAGKIYQEAAKKNVATGSAVNATVSGSTVNIENNKK